MAEGIHRLSDELARDPSSLVYLELGEALRLEGELDVAYKIALRGLERHGMHAEAHDLVARVAVDRRDFTRAHEAWDAVLRIAPDHLDAMKGLGFVCFQLGRFDDAERYLRQAHLAEGEAGRETREADVAEMARPAASPARSADADAPVSADAHRLFADLLVDHGQTALLLDSNGYVLGGLYLDGDGSDLAQEIGAQLSGISDEVVRATRHLDIGEWRSILFETQAAVVALAPAAEGSLLVVAASRATPLGLLRRLLERCARRSAEWLERNGKGAATEKPEGDSGAQTRENQ